MHRNMRCLLVTAALLTANTLVAQSWVIGPFVRPSDGPVIEANKFYYFTDPLSHEKTFWEALHTFNPAAAIAPNGSVGVVFRAEGASKADEPGGQTSRLGLGTSTDGMYFTVEGAPVLYMANDAQKVHEYPGGVEDPRIVVAPDGTYVMTYTQWASDAKRYTIGIATSKNLEDWTKWGPAFSNAGHGRYNKMLYTAGAILTELRNGRVQAVKLHGKYWMYWGKGRIGLATSKDLIHWAPVIDPKTGLPRVVMTARAGHFDSAFAEVGPPPVLTRKGIVLLYNGENSSVGIASPKGASTGEAMVAQSSKNVQASDDLQEPKNLQAAGALTGDPKIAAGACSVGEALFSSSAPGTLLARTDQPVLKPEMPYERNGQDPAGTVFAEGLVAYQGQWLLYYGAADSSVGLARTGLPR